MYVAIFFADGATIHLSSYFHFTGPLRYGISRYETNESDDIMADEKKAAENELMRIGVSLPDNLLSKFDTIIEERGYSSRSEGIRDAIRSYINHYEWMNDIKGPRVATITLVYDHHKRGLTSTMADIQHDYTDIIQSSTHIHIDHDNCLEVIVLDGDGEAIKKLAENILSLNGVKFAKLTTVPPIDKI